MVQRRRRGLSRPVFAALTGAMSVVAILAARPSVAAARPGMVTLRSGDKPYSGDVTEDEKYVHIKTAGAEILVDKRNVAQIDYSSDVDTMYGTRHDKLAATDVKGRMDLATFARDHDRSDLALAALEEAQQIDPANRDVALAIDAVHRQMDLDRRQGKAATPPSANGTPGHPPTTGPATGPAAPAVAVMEHRLLTMDEVNVVRQVEMRTDDRLVKIRFDNNVVRKYLLATIGSTNGREAAMFGRQSAQEQALEILRRGTPEMANSVRVVTDPTPLQLFKTRVMPIVAQGCGSVACHGGVKAGDFHLYEGQSTAAVYTNFYILMTYSAQIGGVQFLTMDREVPERSLALQFGLPPLLGRPPHPAVPELRARFKTRDDAAFVTVDDWLTNDLRVLQPNYGFAVSARLLPGMTPVGATTAPAVPPTTAPATRPAVHGGVPLPRESPDGPVVLPPAAP